MKNSLKTGLSLASVLILSVPSLAAAQDATIEIGGRLMLDYTVAEVNTPDVSVNDSEIRRARLFAKGKFGDAVKYKFEVNHATGDDLELTDGYLQFQPKGSNWHVKVGQYKTHNSLEELTSSRFITTIERGAHTDAFELNRRLGVSVGTSGDRYTFNAGLFGESINGAAFEENGNAASARFTYLPLKTEDSLVHVGASWRYRNGADSPNSAVNDGLRYRQRPYSHVFGSGNTNGVLSSGRIINTGRFAKSDNLFAGELMAIHKNFWAAAEYSVLSANGKGTNADASFGGGYIEAGYIIGGKRTYKSSGGTFNRMKVDKPLGKGGWGALSLVARYDTLDLQDATYTGKLDTLVLGMDWLPTKQTRLRLNYFDSKAENGSARSANGFVARLGFDF